MVVYAFGYDPTTHIKKVLGKYVLYGRDAGIAAAKYAAERKIDVPDGCEFYVVDSRYGLKDDFNAAVKSNSVEGWYEFYDMIRREGIKIDI